MARGAVTGRGVDVAGGPIPRKPGYYGQPVVRPPVWTWEIPLYFFVGGLGGMSAVIALGALLFHHLDVARTAMWIAAIASVLSTDSADFGSRPAASFHQHAASIQTAIGHVDGRVDTDGFRNVCCSRFDRAGASRIPSCSLAQLIKFSASSQEFWFLDRRSLECCWRRIQVC